VELARRLASPNAVGFALVYLGYVHQMRREPEAVVEKTTEALALAQEYGLADVLGWGTVWQAWALAQQGHSHNAEMAIRGALNAQRAAGSEIARPHQLALLADVLIAAGRRTDALAVLDEGIQQADAIGDCYYEPELHRLRGELHEGVNDDEARDSFRRALSCARGMGARSLELRALTSLSRLRLDANDTRALAELLDRFAEGHTTRDWLDARERLAMV
jgi:predicted ATPase